MGLLENILNFARQDTRGGASPTVNPALYPQQNLDPIVVERQGGLPPQVQQMTQPQVAPQVAQQEPQGQQQGQGRDFGSFMRLLGLLSPLIATGAGLASKKALPGAAGYVGGFAGGYEKAQDRKAIKQEKEAEKNEKIDTYTFNPDTGEYTPTGVKIPKKADVRNLTSKKISDSERLLGGTQASETTSESTDKVRNKYVNTGFDENGNQFGMLDDGTVEQIQ